MNKKMKQKLMDNLRESIQRIADPELPRETLWEDMSTDLEGNPSDQAFDADARTNFLSIPDDMFEMFRLKILVTRISMLASMMVDTPPSIILGSFAADLMMDEIAAVDTFRENASNN